MLFISGLWTSMHLLLNRNKLVLCHVAETYDIVSSSGLSMYHFIIGGFGPPDVCIL